MTRRNVKRVDYKDIHTLGIIDSSGDEAGLYGGQEDRSDDDFVSSASPPNKRKKTNTTKTKKTKTLKEIKLEKEAAATVSKQKDNSTRNSRNSNAEICLQQDLMTAIEMSEHEVSNSSSKYDDNEDDFETKGSSGGGGKDKKMTRGEKKKEKEKVIKKVSTTGEENLSGVGYKETRLEDEGEVSKDDSVSSVGTISNCIDDGEGGSDFVIDPCGDSSNRKENNSLLKGKENLPEKVVVEKKSNLGNKVPLKKKSNLGSKLVQNIEKSPHVLDKVTASHIKGKSTLDMPSSGTKQLSSHRTTGLGTPTLKNASPNVVGTNNNDLGKVSTPGRLRLGLSRNVRVAKPLHSNVSIT